MLEAIYGAFAIAHYEAFAEDPFGRGLADEAIWLARVVASLTPTSRAVGPLALFLFIHARRAARRDALGRYVSALGAGSDRWDARLIDEAESLFSGRRDARLWANFNWKRRSSRRIASVGVRCRVAWPAISMLYERLEIS